MQLCVGLWEALHSFILWDSQTTVQREKKGKRKIEYNVRVLCVRAGIEALSCQLALMQNRSTKLELTTSDRMTQNEC